MRHSARLNASDRTWKVDTVINNAGVMFLGPIEHAPMEEWKRMVHVNLFGLLYSTKAALPHLLKAAEGEPRGVADLVNISSVAGRVARLGSGVYNATKHAVGAFSESLRQEVAGRHVRVSLVKPGAVATRSLRTTGPRSVEQISQRFASTQRMEAADIARCDRLHRVPATTCGNQRRLGSADRAAAVDRPRSLQGARLAR